MSCYVSWTSSAHVAVIIYLMAQSSVAVEIDYAVLATLLSLSNEHHS